MDILLSNIQPYQLAFIEEMAKVLGITLNQQQKGSVVPGMIQEDAVSFNAVQDCRFEELESGKVKGYSWDQVKAGAN